jgi:hypothetical protein
MKVPDLSRPVGLFLSDSACLIYQPSLVGSRCKHSLESPLVFFAFATLFVRYQQVTSGFESCSQTIPDDHCSHNGFHSFLSRAQYLVFYCIA